MAMRGVLSTLMLTTGVLLVAPVPAIAARNATKAPSKCPHVAAGLLLAADTQAEVYYRPEGKNAHGSFQGAAIVGCDYARGLVYVLGDPSHSGPEGAGGVTDETLAGHMVAFEKSCIANDGACSYEDVMVVDLRSNHIVHRQATFVPTAATPTPAGGGESLPDLIVKEDGAVAWIGRTQGDPGHVEYEVVALDSHGLRVLAYGPTVEPESLAVAGSTLYWSGGGHPAGAPLS